MGLAQKEKNYNRFTSTRLVWLINADLDVTSKNQWVNSHWDLNNKCMKARNEKPNHTALIHILNGQRQPKRQSSRAHSKKARKDSWKLKKGLLVRTLRVVRQISVEELNYLMNLWVQSLLQSAKRHPSAGERLPPGHRNERLHPDHRNERLPSVQSDQHQTLVITSGILGFNHGCQKKVQEKKN